MAAVKGATIESYHREMAADVASLIEASFAEYRRPSGLVMLHVTAPYVGRRATTEALEADSVRPEHSVVASIAGRPVAAVIATRDGENTRWWRIATPPEFRGRGLASACLSAAEDSLRPAGIVAASTADTVDSRWEPACAFLEASGYSVHDPAHHSIIMRLDIDLWTERPVQAAEGYAVVNLSEDDLEEWSVCKNTIFGWSSEAQWFRDRFMSRHDFDFAGWHVAKHGGRMVGMAGAQVIREEPSGSRVLGGIIEYVGVLEEHRRKGLAEALMIACLNFCKRNQGQTVELITQPFRIPAVRLYEKLGFVTVAEWRRYLKQL